MTNIHTSPAEILILSFCKSSVRIISLGLWSTIPRNYTCGFFSVGPSVPVFTAPPCRRVAEGFNFVWRAQHSHQCCSSPSILHQSMPFISSPYMTASPFSGISLDNIPAGLRDVHRTYICGGFLWDTHRSIGDGFCVMRTELSAMVCVWCMQMSVTVCVWCAQNYQWWCVCDVHRSIRDGLCVMHTDLSVMVFVWYAQIYQWWFYVWCAQNYQWWFLCDTHRSITVSVMVFVWCAQKYQWRFAWDAYRSISDGLHVMCTDLSVRLTANFPPTLSAHTPSPPPAPHLTLLPLPPFSMILHYNIPDGLCVMRTALSVVFTCCPPAPVARNVSISRSLGFTLMSICKTICCLTFPDIIFGTFTVKIHYTRQLY